MLFVLIACLCIERYLHIGSVVSRFSFFESHLGMLQNWFASNSSFSKGYAAIAVLVVPACLLLEIFYLWMTSHHYALSGVGTLFVVLLICLGPADLHNEIQTYVKATESGDNDSAAITYQETVGEVMDSDQKIASKKLTEAIFIQGNSCFLGVMFWAVVFGPWAVLAYRLIFILAHAATNGNEGAMPFAPEAIQLYQRVNWLPARVTSLFYMLVGGFARAGVWFKTAFSGASNMECLITCGELSIQSQALPSLEQNKKALFIVDRAIIIALIVVAIFQLGVWI